MPPVIINGKLTDSSSSVTVKPPSLHDYHTIDQQLLDTIAYDALVSASLHGLLMGDKSSNVITTFINPNLHLFLKLL